MRIEDTELADLFARARGVGAVDGARLLTYRRAGDLTGMSYETWRSIETRRTYEPGPEILEAVASLADKVPWRVPTYDELVAALARDRERLFAAAYQSQERTPRTRRRRALRRTSPSIS